jgi:NAD(P)-dependent dehydrogenase (short-subunit alcohol dehydrogenase family)
MKLQGRRALVTGASQGFGLATAHAFVAEGASVAICARTSADVEKAREELAHAAPPGVRVLAQKADVSDPQEVRELVRRVVDELGGIDVLVCNAGVYGPKGSVEQVDWDEWALAFAINVYGTVLVCREALASMKPQRRGKIIILSGGGATKPLPNLSAYAASKAAIVRFGETLAEETREFGIQVNSIAPGALNTRLLREVLDAGPEKMGHRFYEQMEKQEREGGTPLSRGAALCVFLASSASDAITGRLIAAVWDPWETLDTKADELGSTDIYTLRRIIPEDRGRKWS